MSTEHDKELEKFRKESSDWKQIQERKAIVEAKKLEINEHNIGVRYDEMVKNKKTVETYSDPDFLADDADEIDKIESEHRDFLMGLKNRKVFITDEIPEFGETIPLSAKQLILLGAKSGEGKSTTVANIAYGLVKSSKKPIIISNEESAQDVYPRVYALFKGMSYQKLEKLSVAEIEEFTKSTRLLYPHIKVIDSSYKGLEDPTSTIEGLSHILEAIATGAYAGDAVIIDYYQCFQRSLKAPGKNFFAVLQDVTEILEKYRRRLNIPIVLCAQIKSDDEDGKPFKERIEGSKSIFNRATCVVEIVSYPQDNKTEWKIHKNRFNPSSVRQSFFTGWWRGKFVPYNQEHIDRVNKMKIDFLTKKEQANAEKSRETRAKGIEQGNSGV